MGREPPTLSLFSPAQGQLYLTYELAKNADPEKEEGQGLWGAVAVHPVTEASLMYRLHKRFCRIQLEKTYQEIEQLQVEERGCGGRRGSAGHWAFWRRCLL